MAAYINEDCINCGACIDECPNGAIVNEDKNPTGNEYHFVIEAKCDECGGGGSKCIDACPSDAISLK